MPRGRGIDFEHRFNTSRWAEDLLVSALGAEGGFLTVRFGLSRVQRDNNIVRNARLDHKEPDLLVFSLADLSADELKFLTLLDLENLDRQLLGDQKHRFILQKSLAALEVEFSPYKAAEMTGRHWRPKTAEEWDRRPLKHAKPPTAPNIFIKEEDLVPLSQWQSEFKVPLFVVHLFDQECFSISLDDVIVFNKSYDAAGGEAEKNKLQMTTGIFKMMQTYDRTDAQGAVERKLVFRISPAAAIKAGNLTDVVVSAQIGLSGSKKYVSHVLFSGGKIALEQAFLESLKRARG